LFSFFGDAKSRFDHIPGNSRNVFCPNQLHRPHALKHLNIFKRFSQEMVKNDFVSAFYVQEYSLPSFEVKIKPTNSFILPDDNTFTFLLSAR